MLVVVGDVEGLTGIRSRLRSVSEEERHLVPCKIRNGWQREMKAPGIGGFKDSGRGSDYAQAPLPKDNVKHLLKVVEVFFGLQFIRDVVARLARTEAECDRDRSLTIVTVSVDVSFGRDDHVDDVDSL